MTYPIQLKKDFYLHIYWLKTVGKPNRQYVTAVILSTTHLTMHRLQTIGKSKVQRVCFHMTCTDIFFAFY